MLRLKVLVVLSLGVLVSCVASEPDSAPAAGALGTSSSALDYSLDGGLEFNAETLPTCFNCRAPRTSDYSCLTSSSSTAARSVTFTDPLPRGAQVTGVVAEVYGRCIQADTVSGTRQATVTVNLNSVALGNFTSTRRTCGTDTACDPAKRLPTSAPNGLSNYNYIGGSAAGINTLELLISANNATYCVSHINLTLTYELPGISVTPSELTLTFAKQKVGTASQAQLVEISNTGKAPLEVTTSVQGPFEVLPGALTVDGGTDGGTPPKGTLAVRFTPDAGMDGGQTGTLTLNHNVPDASAVVIALSGEAVASAVELSSTDFDFGEQPVTTRSAPQTLFVRNAGGSALQVTELNFTHSAFSVIDDSTVPDDDPTLPITLAPGASKRLSVVFTPSATNVDQQLEADLTFTTSPSESSAPVHLRGTGVEPILLLDEDPVAFGEQRIGAPAETRTFQLRNNGSGTLTVNMPASVSVYTITPNGTISLRNQDGPQTFTVTFTPTEAVAYNTNLVIPSNGVGGTGNTVSLTGSGVRPTLTLSAPDVAFGEQRVGATPHATLPLTLSNSGSGTLNVTVPASVSAYSITPNGTFNLRPNDAPVALTVTFNPAAATAYNANLAITHNEVGRATVNVPLSGTGVTPTLALSGSSVTFSEQRVGGTPPATRPLTLSNSSSGTLTVTVPASVSAYTISPNGTFNLRQSDTPLELTVTFNPTAAEAYNANLAITHNEVGRATVNVPLSGSGVTPALSVSASVLTFGEQRVGATPHATQPLTLRNTSSGTLTVNVPASVSGYTISPNGSFDLRQGDTPLALTVTFNPADPVPYNTSLVISSNQVGGASASVSLTGTGVRPTLALSVPDVAFGEQRVGATPDSTRPLTLSNSGSGTLSVTVPASVSAYTISPNGTFELRNGDAPLALTVTFQPTAVTAYNTHLAITHNEVGRATVNVPLTGSGVRPTLALSASSVTFGEQRVGATPSATRPLTVRNTSSGTLTVTVPASVSAYTISPHGTFNLRETDTPLALTVTFNPTAAVDYDADLVIGSNEVGRATVNVDLSGTGVTPTLTLSATELAFGEQRVGAAPFATRPLTLSNTSSGMLTVVVPASVSAYTITPSGTFNLRQGDEQPLTVTFNPADPVAYNTTLAITSNEVSRGAVNVPITGSGVRPVLRVPSLVEFSEQRVGAVPSPTLQVRVENTGNGPIRITNIAVPADRPFTVSPGDPFDLPGQSHRDLTVTFAPTALGLVTANLTLTTNDTQVPPATVPLRGTGVRPTLVLSVPSLSFDPQRVGTTSATRDLTLRNSGDGTLTVTVPAAVSAFTVAPSGTFQLGANATQLVRVTFNPSAVGEASASLELVTNQVSQANHTVPLTGTGVRPQLELLPTSLAFNTQRAGSTSPPQVVTVRNRGNGPVRVTGVNVTAGAPFAVVSSAPFDLGPDESQELSVTFTPTATGAVSASLTLTTDESISSANAVALSGTGTTGLDLDPAVELDFGNVPRETSLVRQVRLINSSSVPVTITSVSSLPQVFRVTGLTPGTVVPARSPITFDVEFRPTVQGRVSAVLSIASNANNSPHSLTLVGTGTVPVVRLSLAEDPIPPIASLNFGGVRVTATKQLVVRLTNTGGAPLVISERPSIGSASSAFAYLGSSTPPTLEPNTSFDFPVSFRPEQAINYSDTLIIRSNAAGGVTTLNLSGLGAIPELRLDRTTIFFGDVRVGSRSTRVPITINNVGNADVSLQSLPVEGPYLAEFENPATQLPITITARSSFTFYVVFRPSEHADAIAGSVSILTDINQTAPRVALSGNGTISVATLSVEEVDFGSQRVRRASGSQPLIITNTGKAELEITQLTFSRNDIFAITSPNPLPTQANPLRIAAGEQRAIAMNFTPDTLGDVEGRLFIISNAYTPAPNLLLKGLGVDGQMSLTPSVVRFVEGVQVGGAGTQLSVSLRNTGGSTLTITGVRAPANPAFSVSGLQPGLVLQPGDSWPFTVTFAPTARGYVATSTIIESDAVMNPAFSLALEGTGVAAAVALLPSGLNFGKSNLGVATTQDISIQNVGEKDLYISNVSFTDVPGDPPGAALEYSVSGTSFPQTVEPGKSILVQLRFNPRRVGLRRARANVFTNAQAQAAQADLQGEGTSPSLRLSSPRLDFGNVLVDKPSASRPLTLTNTGTGPLTLQELTLGGVDMAAFTMTAPSLPLTLQPEASVEVSVSLTPNADRPFSAQLLVKSDSADAPSATVGLAGTGVRQQLQVSPSLVDFGQQLLNNRSTARTVSISNSSDTNITLASLSVEGAEASQFSMGNLLLPRVLAPGERLDVSVYFTPQSENALECQLKVAFSDLPTPFTVTLRGKGIPTVLSIRPNPLEFGAVRAGGPERELPLTITNLSNEAVVLDAPSITSTGAPFVIRDVVRDRTLAAGTSTIVNVYYRPMTETLSEATMSFGTLSPPQPRSVNVQARGRAVARLLNVDPGDLVDFGRVDVGDPVPTRDIVIVNRSSQDQRVEVKLQNVEGTPFTVDAKALAEPIPAGGSVTVTVGFAPTEAGLVEGVVEVWLEDSIETTVKVSGIGRALMGQGGGCSCGTGGSGGAALMALLALAGMSVRRRRRE